VEGERKGGGKKLTLEEILTKRDSILKIRGRTHSYIEREDILYSQGGGGENSIIREVVTTIDVVLQSLKKTDYMSKEGKKGWEKILV